jgi:hypothetical protein
MTRLRGRAPRGKRLVASCPHGHWRSTTIIGAVRLDGSTACATIDGATNTQTFRTYVSTVLVPTLRSGDINPVELMWSKIKALLRRAEARTLPDLLKAIAAATKAVTAADAMNWFAHCGYSFI